MLRDLTIRMQMNQLGRSQRAQDIIEIKVGFEFSLLLSRLRNHRRSDAEI